MCPGLPDTGAVKPGSVTPSAESTTDRGVPPARRVHARPRDPPPICRVHSQTEDTLRPHPPYRPVRDLHRPGSCCSRPDHPLIFPDSPPGSHGSPVLPACLQVEGAHRESWPAGRSVQGSHRGCHTRPRGKEPRLPRSPRGAAAGIKSCPGIFGEVTAAQDHCPPARGETFSLRWQSSLHVCVCGDAAGRRTSGLLLGRPCAWPGQAGRLGPRARQGRHSATPSVTSTAAGAQRGLGSRPGPEPPAGGRAAGPGRAAGRCEATCLPGGQQGHAGRRCGRNESEAARPAARRALPPWARPLAVASRPAPPGELPLAPSPHPRRWEPRRRGVRGRAPSPKAHSAAAVPGVLPGTFQNGPLRPWPAPPRARPFPSGGASGHCRGSVAAGGPLLGPTSRSKTDEQNPVVPGTSAPETRADAYDSHSEPGTIQHTRLGQSDDGLSGPSLRGPSLSLPGKLRPGEAERPAAGTVSGRLAAGPPCPSPPSSAWL